MKFTKSEMESMDGNSFNIIVDGCDVIDLSFSINYEILKGVKTIEDVVSKFNIKDCDEVVLEFSAINRVETFKKTVDAKVKTKVEDVVFDNFLSFYNNFRGTGLSEFDKYCMVFSKFLAQNFSYVGIDSKYISKIKIVADFTKVPKLPKFMQNKFSSSDVTLLFFHLYYKVCQYLKTV